MEEKRVAPRRVWPPGDGWLVPATGPGPLGSLWKLEWCRGNAEAAAALGRGSAGESLLLLLEVYPGVMLVLLS